MQVSKSLSWYYHTSNIVSSAGLSCADAIAEHLGGLSLKKDVKVKLTIIEAAERVGGRTMTVKSDMGANVDLGGQWVSYWNGQSSTSSN